MSQDQVVSVRLRRNTTSTPWGFRMQGGHEYGSPLHIQQVNPKSLSHRLGLRVGDRLLAIGPVQAHNMSHEQAKMEIIRAGNELDLIVQRSASAVIDQPDSRQAYKPQRTELVEEPTEYRGYTNPNVQSRSFKILQESLSYSEANEEGIVLPTGNTPGEGIVHKAYSEGRRRLEELSEINPRNFTEEGQSPYRVSEHYNIKDESVISEPKQSVEHDPSTTVVASKVYDGSEPRRRKRPTVNVAQSSVLSPAAGQQQYLQQAHEHYQTKLESRPQQQTRSAPVPQQVVVHQQRTQEKPLKLVNYQFDEQYAHLKRESSSVQTQQQAQIVETNRQKAAVTPQKSNDFIPATETVSSVAADLDLKIVSPGVAPQHIVEVKQVSKPAEKQIVKQAEQTIKPAEQTTKPTAQITKPAQQVAEPIQQTVKPAEQSTKPTAQITKPAQQVAEPIQPTVKPAEQSTKPTAQITKPAQPVAEPIQPTVKPAEQVAKPEEQIVKPAEHVAKIEQTVKPAEEVIKPKEQIVKPSEDTGKAIQENQLQVVQPGPPETNEQTETVKEQADETVNKFAETLSASVVASAQQSIQTPTVTEKNKSDDVDGCAISTESPSHSTEEKVEIKAEQQPVPEQHAQPTEQQEMAAVESKPAEEELDKQLAETKESVAQPEPQKGPVKEEESGQTEVTVQQTRSIIQENVEVTSVQTTSVKENHEKPSETIPVAIVEELNETKEVIAESSTTVTERERRPSLQVPDTDTELNVSAHNTEEEVSFTLEEVNKESAEPKSKSAEVEQTIQVDTQAEEQSFSISVGQTEETSEVVDLTVGADEMASESSVAFEISTDADVSMDFSTDINFTTDVSADVTTDANAESDAAVTLSLEPAANEPESTAFTISVPEEEDKGTTEVSKPVQKITEPKNQNGQNKSKPTKAKFVDSQGGVAARLARFKQK